MQTVAITGATGFVGSSLLDLAVGVGRAVRALTRRARPPREGVTWVEGALEDRRALETLASGADAVIHVAGVVNARDRDGFAAGNVAGTAAMIAAARHAGASRFVHVSSLAARRPDLSDYGWSKRESERLVGESGLHWSIVRPPAIYGPGDMEMLDLFRLARRRLALLPPAGRLSLIEVGDLSRLLLTLADTDLSGTLHEPDDGVPDGWSHGDFARAVGDAVGRRVAALPLPAAFLKAGARIDRLVRGPRAKLTRDRVAYFCHPDWVVAADRRPPPTLWQPEVETRAGIAATAAWYRAHGLL